MVLNWTKSSKNATELNRCEKNVHIDYEKQQEAH